MTPQTLFSSPSVLPTSIRPRRGRQSRCLRRSRPALRHRCARCCTSAPGDPRIPKEPSIVGKSVDGGGIENGIMGIGDSSTGIAVPVQVTENDADDTKDPFHIDVLWHLLRRIALPAGFPSTVDPGYVPFAVCNVLRQLFRTAYYVLGTSSLLVALSVDTGTALTLSSALTWALKDGTGLAVKAGLSSTLGPSLDVDPKRARLFGELLMAFSGAVEACSILRPSAFLPLAALASVLRQSGDSFSGPTYRVFLDTLAISRNIGDVSARAEAQVVSGKLLGLGLGAAVVAALAALPADPHIRFPATGATFAVLATCHLATARVQVSSIALRTLNAQRLHLVLDAFLVTSCVPSIREINNMERVVYLTIPHPVARAITFGAALSSNFKRGESRVSVSARYVLTAVDSQISIALREGARSEDMLLAALHARRLLQIRDGEESNATAVEMSGNWALENFDQFRSQLEMQGWNYARLLFPIGKARFKIL